ncbi:MAG: hypothetical protein AVDCRST_MAG22-3617 [uncultured Rubrobacteraceae bacterium]|uniref:Uncharacterized protein n=1 Tax=uncultured Rubrobacteraceae bacterium TaxID=349277 RepID=A0A6J4QEJ0_9ACTN|nr:MAG: hypothetical protein AVDCRST_MAG22-3617 [uncultured Rubrobacteraceae bacterium]
MIQGFVTATSTSWSFIVTITSPSSSLRNTLAPALLNLSSVSGVGWPYELSAPTCMTAISGRNRPRKSGVDDVLDP